MGPENYAREYAHYTFLLLRSDGMEKPVRIGRSRRCDAQIDNDSMSRQHAVMHHDHRDGKCYITDESSTNGTWLDGKRLPPHVQSLLWPGVHVGLGRIVFLFLDLPMLRKLSALPA